MPGGGEVGCSGESAQSDVEPPKDSGSFLNEASPELSLEEWEARRIAKGRETAEPLWNFVLYCRLQEGTKKVPGGRITEQMKEQNMVRPPGAAEGCFTSVCCFVLRQGLV